MIQDNECCRSLAHTLLPYLRGCHGSLLRGEMLQDEVGDSRDVGVGVGTPEIRHCLGPCAHLQMRAVQQNLHQRRPRRIVHGVAADQRGVVALPPHPATSSVVLGPTPMQI